MTEPSTSTSPQARLKRRRSTIAEEAAEGLIEAKKDIQEEKKIHKKSFGQTLANIGHQIYNKEYREFLTRSSKAWFKLSLYFFLFYGLLAAFFTFMLYIFYLLIDLKTPTYYNKDSVMNFREVNPGLGFRPQFDPESELIYLNTSDAKSWKERHYQSLDLFLQRYERNKNKSFVGAHGRRVTFNYEEIIANSPCSRSKFYGLNTAQPCVLLKLNRIFGWLPIYTHKLPINITNIKEDMNAVEKHIYVACSGESGTDRDNLGQIDYYSTYRNNKIGGINFKYFPFRNQNGYLSPLVFAHFRSVTPNTLINVECKAYAKNIDNTDRLNRRGMTRFQLFVTK
jgi:sodium/potassium-transporting ATPase subunit beta